MGIVSAHALAGDDSISTCACRIYETKHSTVFLSGVCTLAVFQVLWCVSRVSLCSSVLRAPGRSRTRYTATLRSRTCARVASEPTVYWPYLWLKMSGTSVKIIKKEVRCSYDTVPNTVGTRRHCEEHATIFHNPQKAKM